MIQFILHLFGDFVLQNDWMAINKGNYSKHGYLACFTHCLVYSIPFLIIATPLQVSLVFATHFIIDKYGLARRWTKFYKVGSRLDFNNWLHIYLIFMVDMTMHLFCNYLIITN